MVLVHSFCFIFNALVFPTQFLVTVTEFLEHLYNHFFIPMFHRLLAYISFNSFTGDSSIHLDWAFFLFLPILGDFFCFVLFCFSCISKCSALPACLHGLDFCGRSFVILSGADSFTFSLDSLGLPFLPFVCALLLYLGFTYWWVIC